MYRLLGRFTQNFISLQVIKIVRICADASYTIKKRKVVTYAFHYDEFDKKFIITLDEDFTMNRDGSRVPVFLTADQVRIHGDNANTCCTWKKKKQLDAQIDEEKTHKNKNSKTKVKH
jgi:hypothetical protein